MAGLPCNLTYCTPIRTHSRTHTNTTIPQDSHLHDSDERKRRVKRSLVQAVPHLAHPELEPQAHLLHQSPKPLLGRNCSMALFFDGARNFNARYLKVRFGDKFGFGNQKRYVLI
jgi:hypothetical protein